MKISNKIKINAFNANPNLRRNYHLKEFNSKIWGSCTTRVISHVGSLAYVADGFKRLIEITEDHPYHAILQARRMRDAKAQLRQWMTAQERTKILKNNRIEEMRLEFRDKMKHLLGRHFIGTKMFSSADIYEKT